MKSKVKYIGFHRLIKHITGVHAYFKQDTTKELYGTYFDVLDWFSNRHHLFECVETNSIHTIVHTGLKKK